MKLNNIIFFIADDGGFDLHVETNVNLNSEVSNSSFSEEPSCDSINGARKRKRGWFLSHILSSSLIMYIYSLGSRSYGAALLDFSEDFGNRMAEINNEFLKAQKEMHDENKHQFKQEMEKNREILKELFGNK